MLRFRATMQNRRLRETAASILKEHSFTNPDVGPINDLLNTDFFVVTIPKCGTTAIQRGLEGIGRPVIHAHTNLSTFAAFPNGDILRNHDLGMENLIRARLCTSSRPIHVFFGYREPISWYISLAGQFHLTLDEKLIDSFVFNWEAGHPWNNYRIDDIAWIIKEATGIRILDQRFDPQKGICHIRRRKLNLVLYRFDRLDLVASYIQENIDPQFVLCAERVNAAAIYAKYRESFRLPRSVLERLCRDRWFRYFYSASEQTQWLRQWELAEAVARRHAS